MARSIADILTEAEARPNPAGGNGILYRSDVLEALDGLTEPQRHEIFNELISTAQFISPQDKQRILTDYTSY